LLEDLNLNFISDLPTPISKNKDNEKICANKCNVCNFFIM
jgi:hypothetical protein